MAKLISPDKGKNIITYRDEKIGTEWQRSAFDQLNAIIMEACPTAKASIKWAQPVWESAEGPMIFLRSAAKHLTLGFWRGAELADPTGILEGDGDRMKHLKFKSLDGLDAALIEGFVRQAVALNAQKGDPTKGK
jgi:hypothetical protein